MMVAGFMDLLDVTIVNIAIPSIRETLDASSSQLQWIVAGYVLAFGVGLITGGRLGDIFGRKRVFLAGIAVFTVASALCGIATSPEMLVGSRLLQGAAAAVMVPQILSTVHATFPPQERGKVFGMWGAIVGLGGLAGPLLGAVLTSWDVFGLSWRPIFLINVPVGIAVLFLGAKYITETKAPHALRLDLVGVVLGTAALLLLLYPLTLGEELGWPAWTFVLMGLSIVAFAGLVVHERAKSRKDGSPLIELSLFSVKSFRAGIIAMITFGIVSGVFFLVWPIYMQVGLGWSVLQAGLTAVPFSLATATMAAVSVEKLVPRFGRKVLQAGALVMAAGMLLYLGAAEIFGEDITPWHMVVPLVVAGAGMGLIVAPLANAALGDVPVQHAGSASGLINTTQQVGIALGLGLTSLFFFGRIGERLAPDETGPVFVAAFQNTLWWTAGILLVTFLAMFALPPRAMPQWEEQEAGPGTKPESTERERAAAER